MCSKYDKDTCYSSTFLKCILENSYKSYSLFMGSKYDEKYRSNMI